MTEVQCWDGDGAVPTEVKALIRECESLRDRVIRLEEENQKLKEYCSEMGDKLYHIRNIINAESPLDQCSDPVYDPDHVNFPSNA